MAARKSFDILRDKSLYKSIAFTRKERLRLGLRACSPTRSPPNRSWSTAR